MRPFYILSETNMRHYHPKFKDRNNPKASKVDITRIQVLLYHSILLHGVLRSDHIEEVFACPVWLHHRRSNYF